MGIPSGTGAWFSMVLRPEMNPANACMLTLIAGMAVAAGIKEAVGLEAGIKWPNDLVIGGKKICGHPHGDEYRSPGYSGSSDGNRHQM